MPRDRVNLKFHGSTDSRPAMSRTSPRRDFLRALLPDTRLFIGGVAAVWLLAGATGLAVVHPASPVSLSVLSVPATELAPAHHLDALLTKARTTGSADVLWQAALVASTDLHDGPRTLAILDELLEQHPTSPRVAEALAWRGTVLDQQDNPAAAHAYQAAAEAAPEHPNAGSWWLAAADRYAANGQTLPATVAYEAATQHPPEAALAWLALGRLALARDPAAAHVAFDAAVQAARRPSTLRLARLGAATALERLEGPEAALAEVDEAIAHDGADASLERRRDRLKNGG